MAILYLPPTTFVEAVEVVDDATVAPTLIVTRLPQERWG
jgi:hypothetical protein